MKISVLLNVVLALAVVILSVRLVKSSICEASEGNNATVEAQQEAVSSDAQNVDFKDVDIRSDFDVNPFNFFTGDGLLLCAGDSVSSNAMTIGWGGLGTLWGKSVATVYVRNGRYTYGFMEKSKYFTIMAFSDKNVLHYMGTKSGRDGDKAEALGLHTLYTENGTPYYAEADMVMECRTMYDHLYTASDFRDDVPVEMYKNGAADGGIHAEYIGEVVKVIKK